jgi:hypothetical protein
MIEFAELTWHGPRDTHDALLVTWPEVARVIGRPWTGSPCDIRAVERALWATTGVWWLNADDVVETADGVVFIGPSETAATLMAMRD